MHLRLEKYYSSLLPFSNEDLKTISRYTEEIILNRGELILREGQVCDFIMFVNEGILRHYFHDAGGDEVTCDISLEDNFYSDMSSFEKGTPVKINSQALIKTSVSIIHKTSFEALMQNPQFIEVNQIIMSRVNQRLVDHLLLLSEDRPEIRYQMLTEKYPELIQKVPLKYIAGFLRITPESLSRIRKRIRSKS